MFFCSKSQIEITDQNAGSVAVDVEDLTSVPKELNSRNVSTTADILRKIVETNATSATVSATLKIILRYRNSEGIINNDCIHVQYLCKNVYWVLNMSLLLYILTYIQSSQKLSNLNRAYIISSIYIR